MEPCRNVLSCSLFQPSARSIHLLRQRHQRRRCREHPSRTTSNHHQTRPLAYLAGLVALHPMHHRTLHLPHQIPYPIETQQTTHRNRAQRKEKRARDSPDEDDLLHQHIPRTTHTTHPYLGTVGENHFHPKRCKEHTSSQHHCPKHQANVAVGESNHGLQQDRERHTASARATRRYHQPTARHPRVVSIYHSA